jgi:Helix-turn-helix domain
MYQIEMDGKKPVPMLAEREAAGILNMSVHSLRRRRYAEEIEFYRIGGRIFYSQEMLVAFIEKCRNGGTR